MSCALQKIRANLYSKMPVVPFSTTQYGTGWVNKWMGGWVDRLVPKLGLRLIPSKIKKYKCLQQIKTIKKFILT